MTVWDSLTVPAWVHWWPPPYGTSWAAGRGSTWGRPRSPGPAGPYVTPSAGPVPHGRWSYGPETCNIPTVNTSMSPSYKIHISFFLLRSRVPQVAESGTNIIHLSLEAYILQAIKNASFYKAFSTQKVYMSVKAMVITVKNFWQAHLIAKLFQYRKLPFDIWYLCDH